MDLEEFYRCMVTKVVSATTGRTVFYHHVVVEYKERAKEALGEETNGWHWDGFRRYFSCRV